MHTPTLAGNGPGDKVDRTVGHADAVASAIDYVLGEDLTDFVLLGHSYGGTIISRMAEEMPGRIRRLIYWNAFVLEDGESIEAVSPPHYKGLMDSIAEVRRLRSRRGQAAVSGLARGVHERCRSRARRADL